jgi:hypothetical protein
LRWQAHVLQGGVRFKGLGSSDFKLYTCPTQKLTRDMPGTDGGPADRGCKPVLQAAYYVGATNMGCSKARRIAKRAIRGNPQSNKWRCTGVGASFGHCHGRAARKGKKVHWAVNDKLRRKAFTPCGSYPGITQGGGIAAAFLTA